ncbi:MAG: LysR family transcriptional regulator [Candidatus Baltobacteraceae bacterium]
MPITLAQLHTFWRLSELGNFTRTAEELELTQPAVALQVRSLSEHFGVPLVDIVKRRPVLTDAGRFLAHRSRTVLDDVHTLEREMEEFASAKAGRLLLGATLTIGNYAIAPLLAAFQAQHPDANVNVHIANASRLAAHLKGGRIGVALAVGAIEDPAFEIVPFAEDRLVLVVPASGHPFSKRRSILAADLAEEKFVAREAGSATRIIAERELAARGVQIHTQLVVPSLEGVSRAVEAGLGIAILSWLVVERAVEEGRLHVVEIRDVDLRRTFKIARLRERTLSPIAAEFVKFLLDSTVPEYRRRGRRMRPAGAA